MGWFRGGRGEEGKGEEGVWGWGWEGGGSCWERREQPARGTAGCSWVNRRGGSRFGGLREDLDAACVRVARAVERRRRVAVHWPPPRPTSRVIIDWLFGAA